MLIGGYFSTVNGTNRYYIARLNVDGSLDLSFDPGAGASGEVDAIALQADGKVLVGGAFTAFNNISHPHLARLNTNGTLDASFNASANGQVFSTVVQPDGKLVIGGGFTSVNNSNQYYIARLDSDGSLDTNFNSGTGASFFIYAMAPATDGKLLIGGGFSMFNGTNRTRIARLNADGSLDLGFDPGTGASSSVLALAVQPDGKVLLGGGFNGVNDTRRDYIARLNADGSLDTGFSPVYGANASVRAIAEQPNGRILIGGDFSKVNGDYRSEIAQMQGNPLLSVTPLAGGLVFSWPTNTTGYTLQSVTSLGGSWTQDTNPVAVVAGQNTVTNLAGSQSQEFFRLEIP